MKTASITLLEQALKKKKDNVIFFRELLTLLVSTNQVAKSVDCCLLFFKDNPQQLFTLIEAANLSQKLGRFSQAVELYHKAIKMAALEDNATEQINRAEVYAALANAHLKLGNKIAALNATHQSLALQNKDTIAIVTLMESLLTLQDYETVIALYQDNVADGTYNTSLKAYYFRAMHEVGRTEQIKDALDYSQIVQQFDLNQHLGKQATTSLNHQLYNCINGHPKLNFEPTGKATRKGWQMHINEHTHASAAKLTGFIKSQLEIYCKQHPNIVNILPADTTSVSLHTWTVVMKKGGHETSHIHGSGRVSGIYYVEIPQPVSTSSTATGGWLRLGRRSRTKAKQGKADDTLLYIKPKNGLMVIFPSYVYHSTIPLEGENDRVSIAFDLIVE